MLLLPGKPRVILFALRGWSRCRCALEVTLRLQVAACSNWEQPRRDLLCLGTALHQAAVARGSPKVPRVIGSLFPPLSLKYSDPVSFQEPQQEAGGEEQGCLKPGGFKHLEFFSCILKYLMIF